MNNMKISELTPKQRFQLARPIKNVGMLEATDWKRLVDLMPTTKETDCESAVITGRINFVINDPAYDNTEVYIGVLFMSWNGKIELVGCDWCGQEVRLDLADNPLLDDIYYKEIGLPKLNILEALGD